MSAEPNLQQLLLTQVKNNLPPGSSMVDELADLLGISNDSAYRRMRGEKEFSVGELQKVCRHFRISFDALAGVQSGAILFRNVALEDQRFDIREYLRSIIADLEKVAAFDDGHIIYMSKDLPVMQLFQIPEVAAFKTFFWMKTMAGFSALDKVKFGLDELDAEISDLGNRILELSTKIPTMEVWSEETIVSIISQIRYYWQMGLFEAKDDAFFLCQKLNTLLDHVASEAEHGFKYLCGGNAGGKAGNYKLYVNDLVLPDNTIYVKMGESQAVYLSHNVMNYLATTDRTFCERTSAMMQNLIKRSTLVSQVAERERNVFFRKMKGKVKGVMDLIGNE